MPEVPKKPVPEKKVPVPVPKKVEAPPAKGTSFHHLKYLGEKMHIYVYSYTNFPVTLYIFKVSILLEICQVFCNSFSYLLL